MQFENISEFKSKLAACWKIWDDLLLIVNDSENSENKKIAKKKQNKKTPKNKKQISLNSWKATSIRFSLFLLTLFLFIVFSFIFYHDHHHFVKESFIKPCLVHRAINHGGIFHWLHNVFYIGALFQLGQKSCLFHWGLSLKIENGLNS